MSHVSLPPRLSDAATEIVQYKIHIMIIARRHDRGGLIGTAHDATRCHDGPGVAVGRSASKANLMPAGTTADPHIRGRAKSKYTSTEARSRLLAPVGVRHARATEGLVAH